MQLKIKKALRGQGREWISPEEIDQIISKPSMQIRVKDPSGKKENQPWKAIISEKIKKLKNQWLSFTLDKEPASSA